MNSLASLLKDYHVREKPCPVKVAATPKPEKNKVVGDPTRTPINRQAAMITQPVRSWIYQPLPPEKEPNPYRQELEEARAELKVERNDHALSRDSLGQTRQRLKTALARIEQLERLVEIVRADLKAKENVIAQLEDLKL